MSYSISVSEKITALIQSGRAGAAAKLAEDLVKKNPNSAAAWLLMTHVHIRATKRFDLAERSARKCINLAPKDHRGWLEAAHALRRLGRHGQALKMVKRAAYLAPQLPDIKLAQALILLNLEQPEPARALLEALHAENPNHIGTCLHLARLYETIGDMEAAQHLANALRTAYPNDIHVYALLQNSDVWGRDHPSHKYLEQKLIPNLRATKDPALRPALRALAIAKNKSNDYVQSIKLWKESKSLEGITHDSAQRTRFVDTLTRGLTAAHYLGAPGMVDDTPVLVVGLPRCGSTLLTQILSAHPKIDTVGESGFLKLSGRKLGLELDRADAQVNFVRNAPPQMRQMFAENYLDELRANGRTAPRVVDKNLHNFERLGALAAALPRARIIHSRRDPMDQCVSCFTNPLSNHHDYTRDLGKLGDYYVRYRQLMDHWAAVLPNPMIDVSYEDMVKDTEGMARKVIEFLGLSWDPVCLAFQDNETQVHTISSWQVRQPIYTDAIEKWRRYEPHLGPLKKALTEFYPDGLD